MMVRRWSRVLLVAALAASLVANVFFFGYALRSQQEFIGAGPIAGNVLSDYPTEVRSAGIEKPMHLITTEIAHA